MPVRYYDWIAHHRRRTPDKMALVDLASGRRFGYAELDARISRLAAYLRDTLKVASGDRVAVLALNTTDTLEVQFACFRIGAVFLPLNTRLTVPELRYITGDASPKVMIHDDDLAETALAVAKLCDVAATVRLGPGGGLLADGVNSMIACLMLTPPNTTFSQNTGVVSMTNCASRAAGFACCFWLIFAGLFPPVGSFLADAPTCVLGGIVTILFCSIMVSGIKILGRATPTSRNHIIMSISIGIGLGVGAISALLLPIICGTLNPVQMAINLGVVEGEVSNLRKFKNNGEPMEHGTKFGHKWYNTDAYCNGKYIDFAGTKKTMSAMEKSK